MNASTSASPRRSKRKAPTPGTPRAPPGASSRRTTIPPTYEKVDDILDVWFDSGSTHAYVLEDPVHFPGLAGIHRKVDGGADEVMYLEGSDQHRGWFQSSLLESCGTRGRAPFDVVLTHGFTLDEKGRKMSKSLGNQTFPQDIIKQSGADILRLWAASVDYSDDQRIGPEILKTVSDNYRKLRNTIRWMLGTLAHYAPGDAVGLEAMDELERLMLHRLAEVDATVGAAYASFDYARVVAALSVFMNADLSAFYFDIRKDALYCEPPSSAKRRGALEAIDHIFRAVTIWLAPILVFTSEESWKARDPSARSVHLEQFPTIPETWRDEALAAKWETIRRIRSVVTGAIEIARANKEIGSSLEAHPIVFISDPALAAALEGVDFADVCITSDLTLEIGASAPADAFRAHDVPGVAVVVERAKGIKCARSWRYFDPATADPDYPDVTPRDAAALRELAGRGRLDAGAHPGRRHDGRGVRARPGLEIRDSPRLRRAWAAAAVPDAVPRPHAQLESRHFVLAASAIHFRRHMAVARLHARRDGAARRLALVRARAAGGTGSRGHHRRGARQRLRPPGLWRGDRFPRSACFRPAFLRFQRRRRRDQYRRRPIDIRRNVRTQRPGPIRPARGPLGGDSLPYPRKRASSGSDRP